MECQVSDYSSWSPCSVTCGKGIRMRTRQYLNPKAAEKLQCGKQLVSKEMCVAARAECDTPTYVKNYLTHISLRDIIYYRKIFITLKFYRIFLQRYFWTECKVFFLLMATHLTAEKWFILSLIWQIILNRLTSERRLFRKYWFCLENVVLRSFFVNKIVYQSTLFD